MRPQIHPIPSGTRDVLPDEMRELRDITEAIRAVFELDGYGEVWTPALEYEEVLGRGGGAPPAYRVFDDHGEVLALRTDMTVPIARLVATRYQSAEPPLKFCYFAHAYRGVRPHRGQMREFLQAGIELVGAPAPHGTAEALSVACHALDAVGLRDYRIGLGDASLYPTLLRSLGIAQQAGKALMDALVARDFVALQHELGKLGLGDADTELLLRVPQVRGGPEVLADAEGPVAGAVAGLRGVYDRLAPEVAQRVIFDLGLIRKMGYYTGAVFDVYDPALGAPLGGGGRYDDLLGRFGRPLPAVGFALTIDRLHIALTGEEKAAALAREPAVDAFGGVQS
ncbi:MAG: ATP phosphoribosyltransferase regulatory subunit [uncultured Solirubrobacteraceae bacterium]|uniref:ATP phosphoribosyltransferase regulatory subunit n=1 Tax=uncultured Solirubrobacteraceae bacterium TaxID=1162706 RepID=A0A6J4RWP6_9ACTN|nr:MAG: ATP phosphoribosyltransferase regulatory subunit [uncultured Solirubrobacteraceae bacterium]